MNNNSKDDIAFQNPDFKCYHKSKIETFRSKNMK